MEKGFKLGSSGGSSGGSEKLSFTSNVEDEAINQFTESKS